MGNAFITSSQTLPKNIFFYTLRKRECTMQRTLSRMWKDTIQNRRKYLQVTYLMFSYPKNIRNNKKCYNGTKYGTVQNILTPADCAFKTPNFIIYRNFCHNSLLAILNTGRIMANFQREVKRNNKSITATSLLALIS